MQNKANVKIGKINVSIATIKDYDNEQRTTNVIQNKPKQSQSFNDSTALTAGFAQDRFSFPAAKNSDLRELLDTSVLSQHIEQVLNILGKWGFEFHYFAGRWVFEFER